MPEYLTLEKLQWPPHGEGEVNDYAIDWSAFASADDIITVSDLVLPAAFTAGPKSNAGLVSHFEIRGGVAGQFYEIPASATTQQGRQLKVTMLLAVINRKA